MKRNQSIHWLNCLNGRNKGRPVGPEIRTGERDQEFPARAHRSGCSEKAESKGRLEGLRASDLRLLRLAKLNFKVSFNGPWLWRS